MRAEIEALTSIVDRVAKRYSETERALLVRFIDQLTDAVSAFAWSDGTPATGGADRAPSTGRGRPATRTRARDEGNNHD